MRKDFLTFYSVAFGYLIYFPKTSLNGISFSLPKFFLKYRRLPHLKSSLSRSFRFESPPNEYPPIPRFDLITRWQGIKRGSGLEAMALATARAAFLLVRLFAMRP